MHKVKTQILCRINIFFEIPAFYEMLATYCRAGQATYDNMAHAHCMLDT